MRIHLKKRFTAFMLAGMMVTSNVLPAYSATDGIAVEQADASYEADAASADASADAENSEAGGHHLNRGMPKNQWPMTPTAPRMLLEMPLPTAPLPLLLPVWRIPVWFLAQRT